MKAQTKILTSVFLGICSLSNASFAADWIGDFKANTMHRGTYSSYAYTPGNEMEANICGYNIFTVTFEVYKNGVTNVQNTSIWQNINVQVQTLDSQNKLIKNGTASITGMDGNNAVYSIPLSDMAPSAVTSLAPTSEHSVLKITVDGQVIVAPVHFVCVESG